MSKDLIQTALDLARHYEWSAKGWVDPEYGMVGGGNCPVCKKSRFAGHGPDCALDRFICQAIVETQT